jgi:rhodanese-related sulfurtransferase
MIVIAGMVAVVLTSRPPSVQAPAPQTPQALEQAPTPAADPAAAATSEALATAHGGLNPGGPQVEQIDMAEAKGHFDAGTAIFIDVRAGSAYAEGHIPGALTITNAELETRLKDLQANAVIIAYGDSERPESGARGAQIFMEMGYPKVIALEGGFQAWRDAGNPVELP